MASTATTLPFLDQIQASFGAHDVSGVQAHVGGPATAAAGAMGATAYATGNHVAFAGSPDLHTAAHEAAHVVQQRGGVQLKGGVGETGDRYEQHADAVADAVVAGRSAAPLLDAMTGSGTGPAVQGKAVQLDATSDRRGNHLLDPSMLTNEQNDPNVRNANWASRSTLFVNGITPEDVHQTNINDCYFVAVLSSIANSQPNYIREIIREDSPGKYSVRFFEKDPVTSKFKQVWIAVDSYMPTTTRPDGTEQLTYGHSNDTQAANGSEPAKRELWPSVMEKAYAKLKGNYSDIDWGNTIFAYEALFGTEGTMQGTTATGNLANDQTATWNQVKTAIDARQPLVCSTGAHVQTVLSYAETGGNKTIKVRDQAATNDGASDGVTDYPLATFCTTFTYVRSADVNAVARSTPGIHLAGDWNSSRGAVHLESTGENSFTGTYGGGTIDYAAQGGDSMFGTWTGGGGHGAFRLDISADKKSFDGTYGNGTSRDDAGPWTGTRK